MVTFILGSHSKLHSNHADKVNRKLKEIVFHRVSVSIKKDYSWKYIDVVFWHFLASVTSLSLWVHSHHIHTNNICNRTAKTYLSKARVILWFKVQNGWIIYVTSGVPLWTLAFCVAVTCLLISGVQRMASFSDWIHEAAVSSILCHTPSQTFSCQWSYWSDF